MAFQDIVEEEQESVIYIDNEDTLKKLHNPLYMPIIKILREGYRTFKEIKEEYTKHSSTLPPDKTLYRHLNSLKEVGLIFEIGKRVYKGQSMTEKLFARTAKFFHTGIKLKDHKRDEKIEKRTKILVKFFNLTHNVPEKSAECLKELLVKANDWDIQGVDKLFREFPDEVAKIAGNLPFDELQGVVDEYIRLSTVLNYPEMREELMKCLGLK